MYINREDLKHMVRLALHDEFEKRKAALFVGEYPTLSVAFSIVSTLFPERICFSEFFPEHACYTYSESFKIIKGMALRLKLAGLGHGDKVAVCGKNSSAWALSFFAVNAAGCVIVPIDPLLSESEIANIVGRAEVKFAFADEDRVRCFKMLKSCNIVRIDGKPGEAQGGFPHFSDWCRSAGDGADLSLPSDDEGLACILFTSGTTGVPKGVMLTNRNIMADIAMTQERFSVSCEDVSYALLPLHHAYALMATLLVLLTVGGGIVFGKRIVSHQIFSDIKQGGVTIFLGVPLIFTKIASSVRSEVERRGVFALLAFKAAYRISHFFRFVLKLSVGRLFFSKILKTMSFDGVRVCICGGGPLSESVCSFFLSLGMDFMQGYGMTETAPIIALNPLKSINCRSVGKILSGIEAQIRNLDGEGNGTLFVRGANCMPGYYDDPAETAKVLGEDGFVDTGDVGHLDSSGYFYITGRAKNIIVTSGGKNVFPEEIEEQFAESANISQIVIVGYKAGSALAEERIRAVIFPSKTLIESCGGNLHMAKSAIEAEVLSYNKRSRPYKRIDDIKVVSSPFDMTSSGKVKRSSVAKALESAI